MRRARIIKAVTLALAGACAFACAAAPAPRAGEDRCAAARIHVARADALERDGFIDRALVRLREADGLCPRSETAARVESLTKELARTDEPVEELIARADRAEEQGAVGDARRLRDRALVGLEAKTGGPVRVIAAAGPRPAFPHDVSYDGSWARVGDRLVSSADGRTIALPDPYAEVILPWPEAPRFAAVVTPDGSDVYDLASGRVVANLAGASDYPSFGPSQSHFIVWRDTAGASTLVVVDLATMEKKEVRAPIPSNSLIVFDPKRASVSFPVEPNEVHVDLARARVLYEIHVGNGVAKESDSHVVVAEPDVVHIHRRDDGRETFRAAAATAAVSDDARFVAWSKDGELTRVHVRDVVKGTERAYAVPAPHARCKSAWQWSTFTRGALFGSRCLSETIEVDLATGRLTMETDVLSGGYGEGAAEEEGSINALMAHCTQCGAPWCEETFAEQYLPRLREAEVLPLPVPGGVRHCHLTKKTLAPRYAESGFVELATPYPKIARSLSGAIVEAFDASGRARVWNPKTGEVVWRSAARPEPSVAAVLVGQELLTLTRIGTVRRWSASGTLVATTEMPDCLAMDLGVSAKTGTAVVLCDDGKDFVARDATTAKVLLRITPPAKHRLAALGRDGSAVAVTREDAIEIVAIASGKPVTKIATRGDYVISLDFVPPVVAANVARVLHAWTVDGPNAAEIAKLADIGGHVTIARDASRVAVAGKGVGFPSAHVVRLDGSGRTVKLEGPRIDAGRSKLALDGDLLVARAGDDVFAWKIEDGAQPQPMRVKADVVAVDRGRALLDGPGFVVVPPDDVDRARAYLAIPYTRSGVSIDAHGPPVVTGDDREVAALLRCVIGEIEQPYAVCRGRFADPR